MIQNPWGTRCWLLASPRSGSTYLQYLLNQAAGVPLQPQEDRASARFSFGEHLSGSICASWEEFLALDPYVSKIHCHQFGYHLIPPKLIKEQFPGIRFVLLERRNSFAQAVSLALANLTGITQCPSRESLQQFRQSRLHVTDEQLLSAHDAVLAYGRFWRDWLHTEPMLVVTYEALLQAPEEVVRHILDYLKTPAHDSRARVPLHKLRHPQSPSLVQRLRLLVEPPAPPVSDHDVYAHT